MRVNGFSVHVWCFCLVSRGTCQGNCADDGRHGHRVCSGKSPDNFMVRSISSFVDKLRAEKTRLRNDNKPAMRQFAEKIATSRHPRTTILEPINRAEHQSVGSRSSEHSSCQRTDIRARTWEDIVPGHALPVDAETCSVGAQRIPASIP